MIVMFLGYRSGTVNSNMVNSKFHLIRSYCEIFSYHFPAISCLKCTVNSNFHLIRSKTLLTNDFELTVPNLYSPSYDGYVSSTHFAMTGMFGTHLAMMGIFGTHLVMTGMFGLLAWL